MTFGIWHCPYVWVFNNGSQDASDVDKVDYCCVDVFLVIQSNNNLGAAGRGFCRCDWKLIKCLIQEKTILCVSDLPRILVTLLLP